MKKNAITAEDMWQFVHPEERNEVLAKVNIAYSALWLINRETLSESSNLLFKPRAKHIAIRELLWHGSKTSARYSRKKLGMTAHLHKAIRKLELSDNFFSVRQVQNWIDCLNIGTRNWIEAGCKGDRELYWAIALLPGDIYDDVLLHVLGQASKGARDERLAAC